MMEVQKVCCNLFHFVWVYVCVPELRPLLKHITVMQMCPSSNRCFLSIPLISTDANLLHVAPTLADN